MSVPYTVITAQAVAVQRACEAALAARRAHPAEDEAAEPIAPHAGRHWLPRHRPAPVS